MNDLMSPLMRAALKALDEKHYVGEPVGQIDIPVEPTYDNGWWYETVDAVPPEAKERVEVLRRAGIPIKSVILVHEAPKLLPPPPVDEMISIPDIEKRFSPPPFIEKGYSVPNVEGGSAVPSILPEIGHIAWGATKFTLKAIGYVMMGVMFLTLAAITVDPQCWVVLSDNSVICVARWDVSSAS